MTVKRIGRDKDYDTSEYIASSLDEKPTDCNAGSTLLEYDTGRVYIFDGAVWQEL